MSDHALLVWDFTLVSDADWRNVVSENNSQLNAEKWTEKTAKAWNDCVKKQPFVRKQQLRPMKINWRDSKDFGALAEGKFMTLSELEIISKD